ncbi:MAG: DUF4856 domain-containing protein [Cyclobacteriaceae bacterium]
MYNILKPKMLFVFVVLALFSCEEDNETPSLRAKFDYATLTPLTPYTSTFVDASGSTTVNLFEGNTRYIMFYAINNYMTSRISANEQIEAIKLKNMFSNTGSPFDDISTGSVLVDGEVLNTSGVQLRNVVAFSKPATQAEAERAALKSNFEQIEEASNHILETASAGQAGKLGTRLVDAKGIELAQVIQKSLIGALQLDYIGNVLMEEGLNADNTRVVGDKNYTELEHNWDIAYGLLTLNPVYLEGSTDGSRGTFEFGAGSYIWEYNKGSYADIHPAFLKGRAAIVNNDHSTLQEQATFIRTEIEKTVANAALGYLGKWKTDQTEADRAHHIGEGLGFIYSLRFATIHEADAAFSDDIIENLVGAPNGFWDIDADKINAASEAISTKFGL